MFTSGLKTCISLRENRVRIRIFLGWREEAKVLEVVPRLFLAHLCLQLADVSTL